ncbi:hypothetical protein HID58_022755, partial [Brassica napus]
VRVRHLIVKQEAEIYPQWPEDKVDDDLHNLITDILHGEIDDTYWNLNSRYCTSTKQREKEIEQACMKKKMPKERTSTVSHACGSSLNSTRDETFQLGLMEAMNTLTAKVGSMNTVIVEKVLTAVDASVDEKVNARIGGSSQILTRRDYKKYDPKTWKFSDTYKKVFNGNHPTEFSNNRKWLKDVDRLFLCHLINGDHWVALEVDLDKKIIH